MKRFGCKRVKLPFLSLIMSILISLTVILLLLLGMEALSKKTVQEQRTSLEKALNRSVVECYSAEGAYPESLEYIKAHYNLSYDTNLFFVDYQPIGENILPQITVILREKKTS